MSLPSLSSGSMSTYTKLAQSIIYSSIWDEDNHTRIVWVTLLALCDKDGEIRGTPRGIARAARVPPEATERALKIFMAPDPNSSDPAHDGRRLEKIVGGWGLLNHRKYRDSLSRSDRLARDAERKRVSRAKDRGASADNPECPKSPTSDQIRSDQIKSDQKKKGASPFLISSHLEEAGLGSEAVYAAVLEWMAYRKERKLSTWKPMTWKKTIKIWAERGPDRLIAAINNSIANSYQGLFEPKETSHGKRTATPRRPDGSLYTEPEEPVRKFKFV